MIVFETIKWKNFLSTGNYFTKISLNKSPNTLIVGVNGAGKSTILDALCFVLFGKPYRNINKPNLVNSINNTQCVVEIEFNINTNKYKIIRGIKPNVFEIYCNDVLLNQDSSTKDYQEYLERSILKLNYKSFTQIVILGSSSFVPFMQLKASDRRTIIEELLDIQIFSSMNILVKDKLSTIKSDTQKAKFGIDSALEKIQLQQEHIDHNKDMIAEEIKTKEAEIENSLYQIKGLEESIESTQQTIAELQQTITDKKTIESKINKLIKLEAKLEDNINKINKELKFFDDNDWCPTCSQSISSEFKQEQSKEKLVKNQELKDALEKMAVEIEKGNNRLEDILSVNKQITTHNNEIIKNNTTVTAINNYISKLQKEIAQKSKQMNFELDDTKIKELKSEYEDLLKKQEDLSSEKHYYDLAASMLKDTGIKTKIIKQYIPVINKLINKYLSALDFFVNFNIDENFEETIKSRHRDSFSYANFSEGEKQKIDLALLFTWRQVAKLKNSTNTNLLILDEVFDSSLDSTSVELLMDLIHQFSIDTNIFVISHKGDQLFDKFRSVIKFNKKSNFSRIEKA